ncbi:hypothetical protein [Actinoplanes philippinensis]|uniref:hypothetical protein n=1 Tax=Actinoplanes philippinensis TaxID=35752 RepID=UPI0033C814FD
MNDTYAVDAGWSRNRSVLPPAALARQEAAERQELAAAAQEAARVEQLRERNLMLAMDQAVMRGEAVSISETFRTGGANIGRTRAEFLAYVSAEQDREEAIARRRAQKEVERILAAQYGDTTAPTADEEAADRAAIEKRRGEVEQIRAFQTRRGEIWRAIKANDRLKQMGLGA